MAWMSIYVRLKFEMNRTPSAIELSLKPVQQLLIYTHGP